MEIIDCHPHVYSADVATFPTIAEPVDPIEPASAEDLKAKMDAAQPPVHRAVFIQTSTYYGFDNRYIAHCSTTHSAWATGVATLNPDDPRELQALRELAQHGVRGLRGLPDKNGSIVSAGVKTLWVAAADLSMVVNCHVSNNHDPAEIEEMAQLLAPRPMVLDHCLYLSFKDGAAALAASLTKLERLAAQPNLFAKLTCAYSGSNLPWPHVDMHAPLRKVIELYGADRCVWGSDFPQALWTPGDSYEMHIKLFTEELGLDEDVLKEVMGGTARRLWFCGGPKL